MMMQNLPKMMLFLLLRQNFVQTIQRERLFRGVVQITQRRLHHFAKNTENILYHKGKCVIIKVKCK